MRRLAVTDWRCVRKIKLKKEIKREYSCANPPPTLSHPHKTLTGREPLIRQTSKRPLVEDWSPISVLHIGWTWK